MAYQFGVLTCIVVAAAISVSSIIIALWRGEFEIAIGVLTVIGVCYWFLHVPDGFVRRIHILFRNGVPLAPYGFRKNATLGYWLGIPIIYFGHVITGGTLYLFWELSKRPVDGVPLGIGIGFAIMAYSLGIGLVESSYRLWARRLKGITPGDPGSSPLKSVLWSILLASTLIVSLYGTVHPDRPDAHSSLSVQNSQNLPDAQPAPKARVELIDFIVLTETDWIGEATHREHNSSRLVRVTSALRGSLSGGDTVRLEIDFPNSAKESEVLRFQLKEDGHRLNGLAVVERTELANGLLRIVAYGDGQDDGKPAKVRQTFIFGKSSFQLRHYIEQEAGRFILHDEYKFARSVNSN